MEIATRIVLRFAASVVTVKTATSGGIVNSPSRLWICFGSSSWKTTGTRGRLFSSPSIFFSSAYFIVAAGDRTSKGLNGLFTSNRSGIQEIERNEEEKIGGTDEKL